MIKDWPGLSSNVSSICFTAESLGGKKLQTGILIPYHSGIPCNEDTYLELLHQDFKWINVQLTFDCAHCRCV
jgi:hypothetical protein